MTFMYTPDEFYDLYIDGKELSGAAVGVHFTATLVSISHHSDGIIKDTKIAAICRQLSIRSKPKVVAELIDSGLWKDLGDGTYQIDWTHQKTADQVVRDRNRASERQADFRERDSRCKAGDHSMCVGSRRKCQVSNSVSNGVTGPPHSIPLHSSPFQSIPAREMDCDMDLEWSGGNKIDSGVPQTDRTRLAFGHHPDDSAPGGAMSPEAAHRSASAVVRDGVDSEDPVMAPDSRSDEGSGVGGTPGMAALTKAFSRANEELVVKPTKSGAELRLSKRAWDTRKRLHSVNYPLWIKAAREFACQLAFHAEIYTSAAIEIPENGDWPVAIEGADASAWLERNRSRVLQHCMDVAEVWWQKENP